MALTLLLLLFWAPDPLLSTFRFLGRLGLVGCNAFMDSMSEGDDALSAINNTPTSTSPDPLPGSSMSVWVTLRVSCCCAIVTGAKQRPPFSPLQPRCSPFGPPRLTLAPRSGVPGSMWFQNCTSQPALFVYLHMFVKLVRSPVQMVRCTMFLIIPNSKLWLFAVPCYPFFVLTDLHYLSRPLPTISAQDVEVDMGAVSCNLCCNGQA